MHGKPQRHAQRAGDQPGQHKLKGVGQRNRALRLTQHAQHGAIVQVLGGKTARHNGHGNSTQQRRQQGHQIEEFLGPVQRLAHLGAAAFQRFQPRAAQAGGRIGLFQLGLGPLHIGLDGFVIPGHGKTVIRSAGRLNQAGGGHVKLVNHHARRKADEARAPVGFLHDDAADGEAGVAHQQRLAGFEAQRLQQRRIGPRRAGRGNVAGGLPCGLQRVGHGHVATQRVAVRHALEGDQLAGTAVFVARARHRRKGDGRDGFQAQRLRFFDKSGGNLAVAAHHGVAAQQLKRIALQPAIEPVRKKTDRRERRHRQRHGHHQQPQFASPQIAQQGFPAEREKKCVHGKTLAQK